MKLTKSLIPFLNVQNNSHKCMGNCSPAKVQHRFQFGLYFCSFSWGNTTNGEIALLCMSNLMSSFFRIFMKRAPDPALQVLLEPLFLPYINRQFRYVQKQHERNQC